VPTLVLLRHGQSTWNAENRFTGWVDVDLSEEGEAEARRAGALLAAQSELALVSVHTSVLTRAIRTANLALDAAGRSWLPVQRSWRLNERHYGALQGRNKKETAELYGPEQIKAWRRGYATPPPPLEGVLAEELFGDPRYRNVPADVLPATECLADVVRRALPYWEDVLVPDLLQAGGRGGAVLVVAHGNSLRALIKHIEGIDDDTIVDLEVPTGFPYVYRFDGDLAVESTHWLGDPAEVAAAANAVAQQSQLDQTNPSD
jgi:2,3-bisphosphoglycerate-dependent phosphoglycerate mutase